MLVSDWPAKHFLEGNLKINQSEQKLPQAPPTMNHQNKHGGRLSMMGEHPNGSISLECHIIK